MVDKKSLTSLIGTDINSYTITKYISSGSFGDVFSARHKKTNEEVALKIPINTEEKNGEKWLLEEAKVYNALNKDKETDCGVANMKVMKNKELNKKIIVMDLLGPSLEDIISKRKKFRLKTIILLAIQMIELMRYIHERGYIHRDIKPDNFVMDKNNNNKLYCIDFGLAKKYLKRNDEHISFKKGNKFCGTARYASIAAHKGNEQSRKDDLEAIGYLLIYLYRGKLPWQNLKHKDKKERYRMILEKKESISEEELCDQLPREFLVYFKHVKTLDFDEKPRYQALINMFQKLYDFKNYRNGSLEWENKKAE
jgi:serine/threonine protein kinase